jgi:uncharacterized membrane protein YdjX (TVP38/TMEM64 family)
MAALNAHRYLNASRHTLHPYKRLIAVILFLVVLWAVFELSGLRGHFSLAFLRQQIQAHLLIGSLLFILLFALGNLIQIPGWLFLTAAILAIGEWWGGLVTYLAANVSCAVTFFTIRLLGGDALRQIKGRIATRIFSQLDAQPVRSVLVLRLMFQTLPALNYSLAMSGVRFRHYMAGTLLGLPLPIFLYCLSFEFLSRAFNLL